MFYQFYFLKAKAFCKDRQRIHRLIYLFALALLITSLPLSKYLLSIAQFLLVLNWIAEGNLRTKITELRSQKTILIFSSVFVLYTIGTLYSADKAMGVERLKNALPLVVLPLIIGTTHSPGKKSLSVLLLLFCVGVTAAAVTCFVNYLINGLPPGGNFRQISLFLPHLRFAMLIVMAIASLSYFGLSPNATRSFTAPGFLNHRYLRIAYITVALLLTGFLVFLRSATGIIIFIVVMTTFFMNMSFRAANRFIRTGVITLIFLVILLFISLTGYTWFKNFNGPVNYGHLDKFTVNGNQYFHDTISGLLENGNPVEIYICEHEMQREWNKISSIDYNETDFRGQPVRSTLKRYLTSRNLRKDSLSVNLLTPTDISNIENGLANHRFATNPGIYERLYETLYEIHVFTRIGYAEGHTFGQRLVFAIESFRLLKRNFWFGTGQGDVYDSLKNKVSEARITIDPKWEGKPHNQFAFFAIAFGITGLCWVIFCWIYPAVKNGATSILLFNLFATNVFLSMIVLDTLESYSGMMFFAFFYCLMVFGKRSSAI